MLIEILLLLISIWLSIYLYFTRHFNYWKLKKVPYLKPLPFVGNVFNALRQRESIGDILYNIHKKFSAPVVGLFILDEPCLLIRDPKIIKSVLVNDFQYFDNRIATDYKEHDPLSCYMLFISKNPDWKELRTKISPVFTSAKIKSMYKLIEDSAHSSVNYIKKKIKENDEIDVRTIYLKFTIDTISSTAFGVDAHCFEDENSQFWKVARKMLNWRDISISFPVICYFLSETLVKTFKMNFLNAECTKFLKESFCKIMEERRTSGLIRNDLIDIILQLEKTESFKLEDDKLVAQALQFFVAGNETTSSTITFALYELAKHLNIQNQLRDEIRNISEKHNGINYEAIKEMTYLDMCIKETLRMYPLLPFLDRRCNTDYKVPGTDVLINKGTPVMISLFGLHYDPNYFLNPENFDPERFSKTNFQAKTFTYLPFGEGPRVCIGERFGLLNSKIALAYTLKNFEVRMAENTPKEITFDTRAITLVSVSDIKLKFVKI